MADQPSAHHRRDGEGNDAGDHDRDAYSDGKFAEQAPDDAPHQQDGDENRYQRNRHGDDSEGHLAGAVYGGQKYGLTTFQMAGDVLNDDDGVVDDKAYRYRQPHQRQVVEAIPEHVHDAKGSQQRERNRYAWNQRRPNIPQEREDDRYDQRDGEKHRVDERSLTDLAQ